MQYIYVPSGNVIDLGSFASVRRALQDMETLIWLDEWVNKSLLDRKGSILRSLYVGRAYAQLKPICSVVPGWDLFLDAYCHVCPGRS